MSRELKYSTTEVVLNKKWPEIKEKFSISFRHITFSVKTHNPKDTDDSLKFTIKYPESSLLLADRIHCVLTIFNENPEKTFKITKKLSLTEITSLSSKVKLIVPFDCAKITPDSGFIPDGNISLSFYVYFSIEDDENGAEEPVEDFNPGFYISEKCWRLINFPKIDNFTSSQFSFNDYSFHFEVENVDENEPFKYNFICDEVSPIESILKFRFFILNVMGSPSLVFKHEFKEVKKGEKIVVPFDKTKKDLNDPKNGFCDKQSVYFSIVSKTVIYKNSKATEYVPVNCSKEETGYVGLINQGATCYMNSMLQSLYHLSAFRKLVYQLPTTGEENPKKSIPLNLQRLFGQLQLSNNPCSTEALTVSFGWDFSRTFIQHDTQEFCRVLLGNLEEKLKDNEELKGGIAKIFRGKIKNYIRCINVNFESSRDEDFYDLTMDVQGCSNLEESFKKFIEAEKMDGENKYDTGDSSLGKQDAMMGEEFIEFPPVLQLHLRRFSYDYYTDRMVKINDRFEFPEEIDLGQFLAKGSQSDQEGENKNVYDLFGVLVHSGTVSHGHYYAFLRTSLDPQWFEFNDSTVTKVEKFSAIENNFGGSSSNSSSYYSYGEKSYSAYILVYVRRSDCNWIFESINNDEIPEHVRKFIENPDEFKFKEEEVNKKVEKEKDEEKEITLIVDPEEAISLNILSEKTGFINSSLSKKIVISSKLKRNLIYEKVAEAFNLPVNEIRLWNVYNKFPSFLFYNMDATTYFTSQNYPLFLQHKKPDEEVNMNYSEMNVFLKFFSPKLEAPLQYIGSAIVDSSKATLDEIMEIVNERLKLPKETLLDIYLESANGITNLLQKTEDSSDKLKDFKVSSGSSLIFQISKNQPSKENPGELVETTNLPEPTFDFKKPIKADQQPQEKEDEKEESQSNDDVFECPVYSFKSDSIDNVSDYINSMNSNYVKIELFDYFTFNKPKCVLEVPFTMQTSDLKQFINDSLKLDYNATGDIFSLYKKYYGHDYPSTERVSEDLATDVSKIFTFLKSGNEDPVLYLKFIKGVSYEQLKEKTVLTVELSEDSVLVKKRFNVLLEKTFKFEDLVQSIIEKGNLSVGPNMLRIFSIEPKKVGSFLNERSYLSYTTKFVHVDVISQDQMEIKPDEKIVRFVVARADTTSDAIITGFVFSLKVKSSDTFGGYKEKVQKICQFDDEKMKKTHFFVGKENAKLITKNAFNDDDKFEKLGDDFNVFIIPHIKKNKASKGRKEEALKIDN